jgi:hypothetical protein
MILNVGGPSHLDTFDVKPHAPVEIRGPLQPIATRTPGVHISELFPRHAQISDKFTLVRSCHHDAPAVHDAGWQLIQTGRFFGGGCATPHAGAVAAHVLPADGELPDHVVVPDMLGRGGGNLPHGQSGGFLGKDFDPATVGEVLPAAIGTTGRSRVTSAFAISREPEAIKTRYGRHRTGRSLLLARRLVEHGVRFVTVNTFSTVFHPVSWDTHGRRPFSSLRELREQIAPAYDQAYAALIEDLEQRGLLATTLVCNLCEFGRTPRINADGGRDHWPHCFTVYFAGGGVRGGQVVGSSDAIGGYPADRPVTAGSLVATIFRSLGVDFRCPIRTSDGQWLPLIDDGVDPISELFG